MPRYVNKIVALLFLCISFCFAQIDPMKYFYKNRCEEAIPDFAALAVLEKQNCPSNFKREEAEDRACISRYRIIHILDAKFNTLRKEYLEVRERRVSSAFRHRPMLIFGKYNNGIIQIEGYEETREYFDRLAGAMEQRFEFLHLLGHSSEIYAFHSIGSPYYRVENLDSIDKIFYEKFLMTEKKLYVKAAEKDFDKLWQRLTQNRTPIKATKIKNSFAALGVIKNMSLASNSKQAKFYELSMAIETIYKNDAKIDSNVTILIDKTHLPPTWSCLPLISLSRTPFYLFGNLKNNNLIIDSLVSTQDAFIFGDTLYDISIGLPFEELISYFLPLNISFEEFKFNERLRLSKSAIHLPECLRKDAIETNAKWEDFFAKRQIFLNNVKLERHDVNPFLYDKFRCEKPDYDHIPPQSSKDYETEEKSCVCRFDLREGEGVWGGNW